MLEILQEPMVRFVILGAVLLILIIVAVYVVQRLRGHDGHDVPTSHEVLMYFRESHDEGDISDEEFRKLKTVLDRDIRRELNDNGDEG